MTRAAASYPFTYRRYRQLIATGLAAHYRFVDFQTIANRKSRGRLVVLRHDCDNDLVAAAQMARIEHALGVRSTYFLMLRSALYNLLSIPNATLVREIIGLRHRIGLHFDERCYEYARPRDIPLHVERERRWLEREFGVRVDVVSFHQPSELILRTGVTLNCINAYDFRDANGVRYISDSNATWIGDTPEDVFAAATETRVQILLHPEWWTVRRQTVSERWERMLTNNVGLMQRSMRERERAYRQDLVVRFTPKAQTP